MQGNYFDVFVAYHRTKNLIGKYLKELKETEEYKLVSGLDSWYEFLAQPEVELTSQEANTLMSNYEFLTGANLGLNLSVRRTELLKKVDNPQEAHEETALLSYKDMKERLVDLVNEKEKKPNKRTFNYIIMQKCNETNTLKRVTGVDSEEILDKFNINEDGIRYD